MTKSNLGTFFHIIKQSCGPIKQCFYVRSKVMLSYPLHPGFTSYSNFLNT